MAGYTPEAFRRDETWAGVSSTDPAPIVQRPRTPAFQAGNTGSNPVGGTPGGVVKLEFTPACQAGGRGFESRRPRQADFGQVAQLVERGSEKPEVVGSMPTLTTKTS